MLNKPISKIANKVSSGLTPLRSNPEFWLNGTIPWLKTEQLGAKFIYSTTEKISETALRKTSIKVYSPNTLSVAMYGEGKTRGNVSIIKSEMATNQACCNIELDPKLADFEYVYYFLKTQYNELRNLSSGVRKNLNSEDIRNFVVRLPKTLTEQKKIATVLSSLDAKIDCNNRINAELVAMTKALYEYWFVQFDFPDTNGKPYKSSGGKMVYNATLKREIPAGWEAATLRQFIEFERGVTYGKEDVCTSNALGSIGILRATNVTGNVVDVNDLVFVSANKVGIAQTLKKYETLIVMSSGSKEHVGKNGIYYFDEPRGFGAFCSKIVADTDHRFFVNTFLQSPWFKEHIKNSCLGTNIKNLTNNHINDCLIAKPDGTTSKLFEDKISACYETISNNSHENLHLAQLRDWLLPLLMNGQVSVA